MFPAPIHRNLYLISVYGLLFGIMLGRAPGSWPVIALGANWLLEGGFKVKWDLLRKNIPAISYLSLFFMPLVGLLYTSDFEWANNLIRINLPLLAVPLVIFTSAPLSQKEFRSLLAIFLLGCFLDLAWCHVYAFMHGSQQSREVSRFMSHIRLGLFINMAIAVSVYFFMGLKPFFHRIAAITLLLFFVGSLFSLGLASGVVLFTLQLLVGFIWYLRRRSRLWLLAGVSMLFLSLGFGLHYLYSITEQQLTVRRSDYNVPHRFNQKGRPLIHFDTAGHVENGNYVFSNLELEDLQNGWNARMPQDSFSIKANHNLKRYYVLIRYLASCGYTKDTEGIAMLKESDLENIHQGITNAMYPGWGYLHKRLYELINEYQDLKNKGESNGHSFTMRVYYWKATIKIIKRHPFFGVGTGDSQAELEKIYASDFPSLNHEWYRRPHNQYLSIALAFGLCGLIIFLWAILYPAWLLRKYLHPLFWIYFVLLLISFLAEDTLESQAGMAFFVFFGVIFYTEALIKKLQTPVG